jgi:PAS domain S-box-containing protein
LLEASLSSFRNKLLNSLSPRHVIAAGVVIFLAIVLGGFLTAFILRKDALQSAKNEISNLSILLAEHSFGEFEAADAVLMGIATGLGGADPLLKITPSLHLHNYLKTQLHSLRYINSLTIYDEKGQLAASTLTYPAPEQFLGGLNFFRAHQGPSDSGIFIDRPIKDGVSGAWLIRESRRISESAGELKGVVTAVLDVETFQSFYGSLTLRPESKIFLMRADGAILASFPKNKALLGQLGPKTNQVNNGESINASNEYPLLAIKQLEKYPAMVAVTMSETGIYGAWRSQAQFLFIGALATGAITMLLMLLFARHLRRELLLDSSLHRTEESYQALTNQPVAGVVKVDATTGRFLAVNDRFSEITGYSKQQLLNMTLHEITHQDDRQRTRQYLDGALIDPSTATQAFEMRYIRKDGSVIHAVMSSHCVHSALTGAPEHIAFIQDTTTATEQQQRLKEEENRLSIIIQNSMDAIITIDGDENILIFNGAAELMFGYSAKTALSIQLSALIPVSFRARHHTHVKDFAKSGDTARKMGNNMVLKGLRADGSEFPLEASISRVVSQNKVYMTVILRDLTARTLHSFPDCQRRRKITHFARAAR